ncbi:hypothetical protein KAX02_02455 [candidate division WOR-3 bacterium]|nr:hypothetical protein [candidate division WOR-3 bacterium]
MFRISQYSKLIFLLFLSLATFSCKREETPPESPYLIPHSPDTLWTDEGIGAVCGMFAISLEWESSDEERVDYYQVYRISNDTIIRETESTSFIDSDVNIEELYTYWVYSVSFDDLISEPSNSESYKLLPLSTPIYPGDTTISPPFKFKWNWEGGYTRFIIKLWRDTIPVFLADTSVYGGGPMYEYMSPDTLEPGVYRWRVDCTGFGANANREGSRSSYKQFTIQ